MRDNVRQLSIALMDELRPKPGETYTLRSRSKDGHFYQMVVTPDGYAVHQGEGCEGELFNGVLGCWHAKTRTPTEEEMTQALTRYESQVPMRIDFNDEQLDTIASVVCVDNNGNKAPPAFVQLFVAACQHTGLDPFLRQIYALNLKGKWTMYVGIDGYRVISERTGLDEGMDGPQWSNDGETWYDYPSEEPARYCRVGIWRKGVPRAYTAVVSMATKLNPASQSWKDDPNGMLAKCAEALARRRAFPADMAVTNDLTLNLEDPEGVPLTRAEVPEGEYREIVQETPPEPVQAPPRPTPAPTRPTPAPEQNSALTDWLNKLGDERGTSAMVNAKSWVFQNFHVQNFGELTADQQKEAISEIQSLISAPVEQAALT